MNDAIKRTISKELLNTTLKGGVYSDTGAQQEWFGPLEPIKPSAPPEVAGRQLDYPSGFNVWQAPRQQEPVTYGQLRALADNLDILRLVIETRKDLVCCLQFEIVPKRKGQEPDSRCKAIEDFLALPDREHPWSDWLRMLLEDLFVLDAPCIYPRKTKGGQLYALEPVDGATITRKIDQSGRTPMPPDVAYQQVLKGIPAVNYTRDELIYKPRNLRTNKIYGYGPVEQILTTINIAIRRQLSQLQFYTEGTTPDSIFSVPEDWSTDQLRTFKAYWNEMLAGNTGERRKTQFIPGGVTAINTKEGLLKDDFDEWIARVVCYAFSVPANAFIKQQNRATAESSLDQAVSEGLMPILQWVSSLVEVIIFTQFGYTDLKIRWVDSKDPDMAKEADIKLKGTQADQIDIGTGVLDVNEVRVNRGLDPLTPEQLKERKPSPPLQLTAGVMSPNGPPAGTGNTGNPDAAIKGVETGDLQKKKGKQPLHRLTVTGPRY